VCRVTFLGEEKQGTVAVAQEVDRGQRHDHEQGNDRNRHEATATSVVGG
jgi:hypothetical protein